MSILGAALGVLVWVVVACLSALFLGATARHLKGAGRPVPPQTTVVNVAPGRPVLRSVPTGDEVS